MTEKIIKKIDNYYSDKIIDNGSISSGVDWNSKESHFLRFKQLLDKFEITSKTTFLDYGCGYGALLDFFEENKIVFKEYVGFDISEEMIIEAKRRTKDTKTSFINNKKQLVNKKFDFVMANGIFNVKLDVNNEDWLQYVLKTLHHINNLTEKGFSFNILTKYSDNEFMRDYLYYADPLFLFDYCKVNFSKYVSLEHDYPLYEFSIIVKK